jgi:superfamily II DNA or RNA helicase
MSWKDPLNGLSPEAFLKAFMSGANISELVGAGLSVKAPDIPAKKPGKTNKRTDWHQSFVMVQRHHIAHHGHYRPSWVRSAGKVAISRVYSNGTICGTVSTGSHQYKVFVSKDPNSEQYGCNCRQSRGTAACEHTSDLLNEVLIQLTKDGTPLSTRVTKGNFDSGQVDFTQYHYDGSLESLGILSNLSSIAFQEPKLEDLAPSSDRVEVQRVSWNLPLGSKRYEAELVLQTPLKRGGFGKGKKARISAIFQDNLLLSDADKRVKRLIDVQTDRRGTSYSLDLGAAMFELIGEPNVTLDGTPVEISVSDVILQVNRNKNDTYSFRYAGHSTTDMNVLTSEQHLIAFCDKPTTLSIRRINPSEREIIRQLLAAEPIHVSHGKSLVEQCRKLQRLTSLSLPPELGGKHVTSDVRPAIILRSRKDGDIDYGIRMRDTQEKLLKPCEGTLVKSSSLNNEPVQLMRDFVSEYRNLKQLKNTLGLSGKATDGTIEGFEEGLEFIDRLQSLGADVEILWDKASEKPMKFIGTVSANNVRVGISQKRDWFNLTGECTVGDQTLDISALLQSLRDAGEDDVRGDFVKIGDEGWAKISESLRKRLRKLDDSVNQERGTLRFDQTSAASLRDLQQHFQIDGTKAWNDSLLRLSKAEKLEPKLPEGLQATLRDYQQEGFKWLRRLAEWGVGGVLADDMGLGKTVQTLAAILDRAHDGPALVIAPTSVCFNWMREVAQFAPELQPILYRETDRSECLESVGPNQIVVCSYGLALRDAEKLAKVNWSTMVLDEAQAIKNSRSKTSIAIATIPSKWTVALTGTPVENHLGELWSLFHVVSPGVLGGWDQFRNRFATPIEKQNDEERKLALRDKLKPFILRRTKKEVLKDLPPRTEMNLYVELSPAERAVYDQVRKSAIGEIDAIAKLPDIQDQRFKILALLTRLRQIACHPGMVHETWTEGSAKLSQLLETLTQLKEEGHRVLIFSQFVKHLALIRQMLDQEGVTYQYLDGSTPADERQKQVDQFQNGSATAFLISLKAGGTGLNLTAADYVIHMDPWWNPAVEDQATDRAHRIGQDRPVMVYRIVSQNTIEEEILKLHDTKRDLVAGILDGSHSAGKLSTEDLIALIRQ